MRDTVSIAGARRFVLMKLKVNRFQILGFFEGGGVVGRVAGGLQFYKLALGFRRDGSDCGEEFFRGDVGGAGASDQNAVPGETIDAQGG